MHSQAGKAPRVIATQIALVYLRKDGRIVHQHEQVTLEGAAVRDRAYVEQRALEHAARRGHAGADVAILHVDSHALEHKRYYSVDPESKRLVERPGPEHRTR